MVIVIVAFILMINRLSVQCANKKQKDASEDQRLTRPGSVSSRTPLDPECAAFGSALDGIAASMTGDDSTTRLRRPVEQPYRRLGKTVPLCGNLPYLNQVFIGCCAAKWLFSREKNVTLRCKNRIQLCMPNTLDRSLIERKEKVRFFGMENAVQCIANSENGV